MFKIYLISSLMWIVITWGAVRDAVISSHIHKNFNHQIDSNRYWKLIERRHPYSSGILILFSFLYAPQLTIMIVFWLMLINFAKLEPIAEKTVFQFDEQEVDGITAN